MGCAVWALLDSKNKEQASRCRVAQRVWRYCRHYARQVLEPSIRGFLSILEKQFPRNDLYLFELQNSVDDGRVTSASSSQEWNGLEFFHNGRGFNSLDV